MTVLTHDPGHPLPSGALTDSGLRRRYHEYCRQQVAALVALLPREAVRPLYRRAKQWAVEAGVHEEKDPMATLHRFCRRLLPLPPFEVWLADYDRYPLAHLGEVLPSPDADDVPMAVASARRAVAHDGAAWSALLNTFRDGGVWRGFISFTLVEGERVVRTADIFCEDAPEAVRARFEELTDDTLRAFLRSALP
ncbi:MAG: hypothetical protein D6701_00565 [Gemmatimonadetes bacterium]|nr:MAG: hypothetical protein D6701_00565 [Gemmatimonadota bacterium]